MRRAAAPVAASSTLRVPSTFTRVNCPIPSVGWMIPAAWNTVAPRAPSKSGSSEAASARSPSTISTFGDTARSSLASIPRSTRQRTTRSGEGAAREATSGRPWTSERTSAVPSQPGAPVTMARGRVMTRYP